MLPCAYIINELKNTVTALKYQPRDLTAGPKVRINGRRGLSL